jgi:hypothetical protein
MTTLWLPFFECHESLSDSQDDKFHEFAVSEMKECHGDMGRGRLARAYASREGYLSWGQLVPVLTDNL